MTHPAPAFVTMQNLESAFGGESMAHAKYRYFAKICREQGDVETAAHFEATAAQEILHAHGHLELLYPRSQMSVTRCLELAIEGETYEFTQMYPEFKKKAQEEGLAAAVAELNAQIEESRAHAAEFVAVLAKATKRFAALARVEERHADAYSQRLASIQATA